MLGAFSTDIIPSGGDVAAVLELNAGQAEKIGVKPGDRVVFPGLDIAMPDEELRRMGGNAREWFLRNDREFEARLKAALDPLFD